MLEKQKQQMDAEQHALEQLALKLDQEKITIMVHFCLYIDLLAAGTQTI